MRQHASACVSMRQHTCSGGSVGGGGRGKGNGKRGGGRVGLEEEEREGVEEESCILIRQQTSDVSIGEHT